MARNKLTFDPIDLIEAIERRPCLWDKNNKDYKDKAARETAWRDVCRALDEDFDSMGNGEKRTFGKPSGQ